MNEELDRILLQYLQDHSKAQAHDRLQEHRNADERAKAAIQRLVVSARKDELKKASAPFRNSGFIQSMTRGQIIGYFDTLIASLSTDGGSEL